MVIKEYISHAFTVITKIKAIKNSLLIFLKWIFLKTILIRNSTANILTSIDMIETVLCSNQIVSKLDRLYNKQKLIMYLFLTLNDNVITPISSRLTSDLRPRKYVACSLGCNRKLRVTKRIATTKTKGKYLLLMVIVSAKY